MQGQFVDKKRLADFYKDKPRNFITKQIREKFKAMKKKFEKDS